MNKVLKFLLDSAPPRIGHQLNALETIGNTFLAPFSHAAGTFYVKMKVGESLLLQKISAVALIIIMIPLTLVGIVLKGIGQVWPHKKIHVTDVNANIRLTASQRIRECYDQVKMMQQVFIENGFVQNGIPQFMIMGGTALGAERHGGMIPWDDDIDIVIFDEKGFLTLKDKLLEAGFEFDNSQRFGSLFKLKFTQEKFSELYPNADYSLQAELDIFIWSKMADGSYTHDTLFARSKWPCDYITGEEMQEGLEMKSFGKLQLPGLKSQPNYLKRFYGENCLTHGIETHSHARICGIMCPVARCGAHFFEIQKYKQCASNDY